VLIKLRSARREREGDGQTDRESERERERERERGIGQAGGRTDRHTDRQTNRERERERTNGGMATGESGETEKETCQRGKTERGKDGVQLFPPRARVCT